ncbi:GNAT family N-acetyltransferase [Candidatus Bealeia paramacronuclearis]|uniref:GNAT family N-acetyltransferase n=1 Tax=Candidatus Bealeia paramacronuclearis TaxID=1921001 RepID=A0ABZ2C5H4_9PROT|nr:GNAT family N-acetyltransferase [Candidatus Bealeia paramacronuclearis]
MDFVIREAQIIDAKDIATVHIETWQSSYKGVVDQAYLDALELNGRILLWERLLQQNEILHLVAIQSEKIIGFCSAGPARKSSALESLNRDLSRMGEIHAI